MSCDIKTPPNAHKILATLKYDPVYKTFNGYKIGQPFELHAESTNSKKPGIDYMVVANLDKPTKPGRFIIKALCWKPNPARKGDYRGTIAMVRSDNQLKEKWNFLIMIK